jgi:hypothetical protein
LSGAPVETTERQRRARQELIKADDQALPSIPITTAFARPLPDGLTTRSKTLR